MDAHRDIPATVAEAIRDVKELERLAKVLDEAFDNDKPVQDIADLEDASEYLLDYAEVIRNSAVKIG